MSSILDTVLQHLGGSEIRQISQHIGADDSTTRSAISAALPMMLGGMADMASQPGGVEEIDRAAESHSGILGNLSGLLGAAPLADRGGSLLERLLGGKQEPVQQAVSQSSGLDLGQTRKLLMLLAPVVLGVLAHKKHEEKLNPSQLGSRLQDAKQSARQQASSQAPSLGGLLGDIFGR